MNTRKTKSKKPKIKIVIYVQGGCVTGARSNVPHVEVDLIDYDNVELDEKGNQVIDTGGGADGVETSGGVEKLTDIEARARKEAPHSIF